MPEPARMDNRTLIRKTLLTMGVMVGACAFVVGTLTLVAVVIVGHATGPKDISDSGSTPTQSPTGPHAPPAVAKPMSAMPTNPNK